MSVRLNKHLADLGHASRRGAEALILEGRVRLNGETVTDLATRVDPDVDKIEVTAGAHGRAPLVAGYVLNKPVGYVTTKGEGEGSTILDLLPAEAATMSYAGRLDKDSRGLLLLLADGRLSYAVTAPETHLEKEYLVRVEPEAKDGQLEKMRAGISLDGKATRPVKIERRGKGLVFFLSEGRKRQIRRMCDKVGLKVVDLQRVRIGPLKLDGIEEGKARPLHAREFEALKNAVTR